MTARPRLRACPPASLGRQKPPITVAANRRKAKPLLEALGGFGVFFVEGVG